MILLKWILIKIWLQFCSDFLGILCALGVLLHIPHKQFYMVLEYDLKFRIY